jgi:hypothetical protein
MLFAQLIESAVGPKVMASQVMRAVQHDPNNDPGFKDRFSGTDCAIAPAQGVNRRGEAPSLRLSRSH